MTSQRKAMRAAAAAIITAGVPALADNVYANRVLEWRARKGTSMVPGCSVYTSLESVVEETQEAPPAERREVTLVIEVVDYVDSDGATLEDRLDDYQEAVEVALDRSDCLNGTVDELRPAKTTIGFDPDAAELLGVLVLEYRAIYERERPGAADPTDDFAEAHADVDTTGDTEPEIEVEAELETV